MHSFIVENSSTGYNNEMKIFFKVCCCLPLLLIYLLLAAPVYPLIYIAPFKSRFYLNHMAHYLCKVLLFVLSVKVNVEGKRSDKIKGKLIVCNHVSYLDILVLASQFPTCFVTSNEMKNTPGLGIICILGGCVFVERRNRENIDSEVEEIKVALENNLNVMFYPEAKSTDGSEVIPFKRSLFHAAVMAKTDTLPLCINYQKLNGELVTKNNRDKIFWYGDMGFASHFLEICMQTSIEVKLTVLDLISLSTVDNDSKELRNRAFEVIQENYKRIN